MLQADGRAFKCVPLTYRHRPAATSANYRPQNRSVTNCYMLVCGRLLSCEDVHVTQVVIAVLRAGLETLTVARRLGQA